MTRRPLFLGAMAAVGLFFAIASPVFAGWTTQNSTDEMSGEKSCSAISERTTPTRQMAFPYGDVCAWLVVAGDKESDWVYIAFSDSPNLTNTTIEDGHNRIRTRIKWDDKIENVTLTQDWGEKYLHFVADEAVIAKIEKSQSVLLELDWYGSGTVYFRFLLSGSTAAIAKMRESCAGPQGAP